MLINLTDYFEVTGKSADLSVPFEAEIYNDGFKNMPIVKKSDIKLNITNIGDGKLEIKGNLNVTLRSLCDRCLEDVDIEVPVEFEVDVVKPDGYHKYDEEEQGFLKGYELDCEALIDNEMIMSLPMKVLCREDCKGLCPVCGKNLNDGECGCDTFVPDPRMAAISDIFNAYKEV